LSIHKSAPLVDPRPKAGGKPAAAKESKDQSKDQSKDRSKAQSRNGSGRRNGGLTAKSEP
jgi:hypothetical protein